MRSNLNTSRTPLLSVTSTTSRQADSADSRAFQEKIEADVLPLFLPCIASSDKGCPAATGRGALTVGQRGEGFGGAMEMPLLGTGEGRSATRTNGQGAHLSAREELTLGP